MAAAPKPHLAVMYVLNSHATPIRCRLLQYLQHDVAGHWWSNFGRGSGHLNLDNLLEIDIYEASPSLTQFGAGITV